MNNYQKFNKHYREGGLINAVCNGIKYFIFIMARPRGLRGKREEAQLTLVSLKNDDVKLTCHNFGVKIYWGNTEITYGIGLNSALNTLGLLTDSSKACWEIIEEGIDYFKAKVSFRDLPVVQIWDLKIESDNKINWQIYIEPQEDIYIDEIRVGSLVSARYKTWFCGYEHGDFPRISGWQDMLIGNRSVRKLGVRLPTGGEFLPSLLIDFEETEGEKISSIIQNTSTDINAHYIGIEVKERENKGYYTAGTKYKLPTAQILLFRTDESLDSRIEKIRQKHLKDLINPAFLRRKKIKVLLVNLPWQRDGRWGVRAGSRWPHIKDKSEGNYLPFPFFLAYATALLQKNGIKTELIDAIADEIPEDKLIERILSMDFDYVVAETSIPSFYEDLEILEKMHQSGISVILCGPNALIYEPQFLKENISIDFVLYGEYEFSLLNLIKSLQENGDLSKVNGLIYRSDKEVIKNPGSSPFDINLLPWPYRDGLPMEKYWDLPGNIPHPSVQMLASRGCPFGCDFCLWPQVMYGGNLYRTRTVKDVIDEMEYLVRDKGFKSVYWDDDTFNIGKERMLEFCKEIKKRRLENIPWAIMARPDLMDEETLKELSSAGLWAVKYGVESFSQKLVTGCHKNMDIAKTTRMIKLTAGLGIKTHLTFCFGLSGETSDTIQETIDYALKLNPESIQFSILTPFPGTALFEELNREGRILSRDWSRYDGNYNCIFQPDWLTPQDLENARRQAYLQWGEHLRKRRGFKGDIRRFNQYIRQNGLANAILKTCDYLSFVWIKK